MKKSKIKLAARQPPEEAIVFLTVPEVAAFTGLSVPTIYSRVSKRLIPFYRMPHGRKLVFNKSEITLWLTSEKSNSML